LNFTNTNYGFETKYFIIILFILIKSRHFTKIKVNSNGHIVEVESYYEQFASLIQMNFYVQYYENMLLELEFKNHNKQYSTNIKINRYKSTYYFVISSNGVIEQFEKNEIYN